MKIFAVELLIDLAWTSFERHNVPLILSVGFDEERA